MAAKLGHEESSRASRRGMQYVMKCERGKTAADYAREKKEKMNVSCDSSNEVGKRATRRRKKTKKRRMRMQSKAKQRRREVEGRRRRWKRRNEAARAPHPRKENKKKESKKDKEKEEEDEQEAPEPKWPEVKKAMKEKAKELTISRKLEDGEQLDLAMFYCSSVNTLKIECGKSLTQLPKEIKKLKGLLTLIISENGLTCFRKRLVS